MTQEPTNNEILEAINEFSTKVDGRFDKVDERLGIVEKDVSSLKTDVGYLKSNMVTKDHLDEKLTELKGEIILIIRKEDLKLTSLVELLRKNEAVTTDGQRQILSMEPFPQLLA
ncbi:MAG: hypothetical protein V2A74_09710 [bacterium]